MIPFVIAMFVMAVVLSITIEVIKFIWKVLSIRVFGFKPLTLDPEQLQRTVAYCPKEYIREAKRINPRAAGIDPEEERRWLDDLAKFTELVVMHYLDGAKEPKRTGGKVDGEQDTASEAA